jgi:hypothetical protein
VAVGKNSTTKLGKALELRRQTVGRIRLSVARRVIVVGLAAAGMREINMPGRKTPNEKQIGPVMKGDETRPGIGCS